VPKLAAPPARELIQAVEEWGRQNACTELASDALLENPKSDAVHCALGFSETERACFFASGCEANIGTSRLSRWPPSEEIEMIVEPSDLSGTVASYGPATSGLTTGGIGPWLWRCRKGEGRPTVVFLPEAGIIGLDYFAIHERVADFSTSVLYDRDITGWSEQHRRDRSAAAVRELWELLNTAGLAPFLHSSGTPLEPCSPAVISSYTTRRWPTSCCLVQRGPHAFRDAAAVCSRLARTVGPNAAPEGTHS
jgi:hypothetical protein